jgi:uncharacterized alpha-E superfamily protein
MLMRSADSVFWIGRYMERAENLARLIDVNLALGLDLPPGISEQWKPLVATTGDLLRFLERYDSTTRETVIEFLTFDAGNPNSILSCLRSARENARSIRDVISSDMWEHLNATYLQLVAEDAPRQAEESPHQFFSDIKLAARLFEGLTDDTMLHGEGWHFCRLGRMIERADKISRIVDLKHYFVPPAAGAAPIEDMEWTAILQSAHGLELYRKRHGRLARAPIVGFLLLDQEFPRSVHFSLTAAEDSLHAIGGTPAGTFRNPAEQRLGQIRSELAYAKPEDLLAEGLHEFLDALQLKLNLAGDAVTSTYLVPQTAMA